MPAIRALEFFCGIGGLHYGLLLSQSSSDPASNDPAVARENACTVVEAYDINHVTNAIYTHNFGVRPEQKAIEKLTVKELDAFKANVWLLSPPCQPFTRGGKRLDDQDPRSKGLLHLISLIPKLSHPPTHLLLENVVNFETSQSRNKLVSMLTRENYEFEEWILSPLQFGIPNDRKRYYLTARKKDVVDDESGESSLKLSDPGPVDDKSVETAEDELITVPLNLKMEWPYPVKPLDALSSYLDSHLNGQIGGSTPHMPASSLIGSETTDSLSSNSKRKNEATDVDALKIPEAFVKKRKFISDGYVVGPADKKSACFTKAYGHHGIGAGSFLQTKGFDVPKNLDDPSAAVETYGLRFFSPMEVARLHGFPVKDSQADSESVGKGKGKEFSFPTESTLIQRYRVLGNSLNVLVVAGLLKYAVFGGK
ncbi:S-adenosyl-L-methionine-dependent methyltransferase [Chytriomyces cf. hyalinus JEL632]|nr:S-adenosyl-L-methionine-dependent methyltransferase [Chytriomyces cf. hyalinus JEL632]